MKYIKGMILTSNGLKKGYVKISGSQIIEMGQGSCPTTPDYRGLVCPTFINMHTHLGDAFIAQKKIPLPHDINKLVAPPNGLKHQLLQNSNNNEIITGIKHALQTMIINGTSCFIDFRENGEQGINCIKEALEGFNISSFILSRPKLLEYHENEIHLLLDKSDGIGLSSLSDWDYEDIKRIAENTKKRKKYFALHVSERVREDIKKIIDLQPDFIVHMIKATKKDLRMVKNHDIPIVICPRSNAFFHMTPPLQMMKDVGNTILIGSDNAMLHPPIILEEVKYIHCLNPGLFTLEELLNMITYKPRKVLNLKDYMHGALFSLSSYIILNERTLKPIINKVLIRDGCYES